MSAPAKVPTAAIAAPPAAPAAGTVARQEFSASEIATTAEVGTSAMEAQARAEIEARYVMALRNRRRILDVRDRILAACERTRFARAALYSKPMGGSKITGLSIRFAEEAFRDTPNLDRIASVVYDDREKRIIRVILIDLETNNSWKTDVTVEKTVERKNAKDRQVLSVRTNSSGGKTYTVVATDDEMLAKQNALISKAERTLVLKMLPGDIQEEARDTIEAALRRDHDADPTQNVKRHADAFAGIGVKPSELEAYLGHDLAKITAAEAADLEGLYNSLKSGDTNWAEVMETRHGVPKSAAEAPKPATGAQSVKDALKSRKATADPAPAPKVTGDTLAKLRSVAARVFTNPDEDVNLTEEADRFHGGIGLTTLLDLSEKAALEFIADLEKRAKKA